MEIRKLQRSTDLLLRMLPFQRLVREVATNYTSEPFRFTAEALLALQEASEDMLVRHTRASLCYLLPAGLQATALRAPVRAMA